MFQLSSGKMRVPWTFSMAMSVHIDLRWKPRHALPWQPGQVQHNHLCLCKNLFMTFHDHKLFMIFYITIKYRTGFIISAFWVACGPTVACYRMYRNGWCICLYQLCPVLLNGTSVFVRSDMNLKWCTNPLRDHDNLGFFAKSKMWFTQPIILIYGIMYVSMHIYIYIYMLFFIYAFPPVPIASRFPSCPRPSKLPTD